MDFDELTTYISHRLQQPLPGAEATREMSARISSRDRERFRYSESPKSGSVMILLYPDHGTIRFPLIQRPEYPGVHSGQMALPGGKREGDEDEVETALRETEEEIGIARNEMKVLGKLTSFYVFASNFQLQPVVGMVDRKPVFTPQQTEVAEIVEADLRHLLDERYKKEKTITPRQGIHLQAPYFDLENKTVWGATAMMLNELKWILKEF